MVNPTGPSNPASPNNNPTDPYTGAAMQLPTAKLSPNDPWISFFTQMFPNCPPGEVEHFAGTFKNNMYQWVENEIKKDQDRAHKAAEDAKRRMLNQD